MRREELKASSHFVLSGKTAVVTGASGDIGHDIVVELAKAGVHTVAIGRNQRRLQETVSEARSHGPNSTGLSCDVRIGSQVRSTVRKIEKIFDHFDILINNAGVGSLGDISSIDEKTWDNVIETNLKSVFLFCSAMVPIFRKQRHGRIINIASIAAQNGGSAGAVSYTASKGGIISFTKTLSRDMAPYGVTVNAVAPGVIDAGMGRLSAKQKKEYTAMIPIGRVGTGKDVAYAVLFLASDEAEYITGVTLDVNGGVLKR